MGMKQILVMMAAVVLVGCSNETLETSQAEAQVTPAPSPKSDPVSPVNEKLIIETAIRMSLKMPIGELTEVKLKEVTQLRLYDTKITDEGLEDVAKLQNLTKLGLGDTQITDEGLKEVAKLQKLEWLSLKVTQITDAELKELANLQSLRQLYLSDTQITDDGFKELVKLQKLVTLYLDKTKVTKEGVVELRKALPKCNVWAPNPLP